MVRYVLKLELENKKKLLSKAEVKKESITSDIERQKRDLSALNKQKDALSNRIQKLKKENIETKLMLRKQNNEVSELRSFVRNALLINLIKVTSGFECKNGLIGMNRDIILRLIRTMSKKKIRNILGIGKQLYLWKNSQVWKWVVQQRHQCQMYFLYHKILDQECGISKEAMNVVDAIVKDIIRCIANSVFLSLSKPKNRKSKLKRIQTVTWGRIKAAVRLVFPDDLFESACERGALCMLHGKYRSIDLSNLTGLINNILHAAVSPSSSSSSSLPSSERTIQADASAFLAGCVEKVAGSIMWNASNIASEDEENEKDCVCMRHVVQAVWSDEDLSNLLLNVADTFGGRLAAPCFAESEAGKEGESERKGKGKGEEQEYVVGKDEEKEEEDDNEKEKEEDCNIEKEKEDSGEEEEEKKKEEEDDDDS